MKCKEVKKNIDFDGSFKRKRAILYFHLFFCSSCREETKKRRNQMEKLATTSPFYAGKDLTGEIMEKVNRKEHLSQKEEKISLKWASAGLFLLLGAVCLNYNESFIWLKEKMGGNLEPLLNVFFALFVSFYFILFSIKHEHFFRKKIKKPNLS